MSAVKMINCGKKRFLGVFFCFFFKCHSFDFRHVKSQIRVSALGSVSDSSNCTLNRDESHSRSKSCVTFESMGRGNGGWECAREGSTSSEIRGILPSCFLWVREDGGVGGERETERKRERKEREFMARLELSFSFKQLRPQQNVWNTIESHQRRSFNIATTWSVKIMPPSGGFLLYSGCDACVICVCAVFCSCTSEFESNLMSAIVKRKRSAAQRNRESRENKVKIDTSGRRKDPQLSSLNPPPSPLCLCSSRPLLSPLLSCSLHFAVWLEWIILTRVLVTAYYFTLCLTQQPFARTGSPSVHAACSQTCSRGHLEATQAFLQQKRHRTMAQSDFLVENGVRNWELWHERSHIFHPFCRLGTHCMILKVGRLK